ncbi:MAG TPA: MBOAT family O-acyltransferase [Candidatus Methylacidiphilales bacterium]
MLYTDTLFLILLGALLVLSRLLRSRPAAKEWLLIAFSLLVIATWGYYDLVLFLAVLGVNFAAARWLPRLRANRAKALLAAAISFDVGTLALFKYANFLGGAFSDALSIHLPRFPLGIPLAISFYVFHLVSYLVDIHKKRVHVATFREYLFYLSFFPHVIAGPIVRAWQLIPQIGRVSARRARTDLTMGCHYLVLGFFLKTVGANNIARAIDPYWVGQAPFDLTSAERWIVAFLYYCQIYGDFAGYSLMALGMARLLGYRLPANFRAPMRAASLQEFWHRWHITLSRWLRDYLYIPLGGGRAAPARVAFNVFATFLLGGLWHGAAWGFVVWGAMHGAGLVAERVLGRRKAEPGPLGVLGFWAATQAWILLTWVFFRAPDLGTAWEWARAMIVPTPSHSPAHPAFFVRDVPVLGLLVCAVPSLLHHFAPDVVRHAGRRRLGTVLGLVTGALFIVNLIVLSPGATFLYFRF